MGSPAEHAGGQGGAVLVCGECGTRNGDGENFCSNCGAYLAWDGQRIGPDPRETPPEPELPPVMPGFVKRVKWAVGLDDGGTGAPPARRVATDGPGTKSGAEEAAGEPSPGEAAPYAAPRRQPIAGPLDPPPPRPPANAPTMQPPPRPAGPPPRPAGPPPRPAGPPSGPAKARKALPEQVLSEVGTQTTPRPTEDPPAVKPGERVVKPGPRPRQPLTAGPQPGELICGQCGAGNRPDRKYCRLCAAELADAPLARKKHWWQGGGRALLDKDPRRNGPAAGTRPRIRHHRRFPARWAALLLVLAVAGGGAYLGRDALLGAFNFVQDRLVTNEPIHSSSITASSFLAGREPALAVDGTVNRSWAPAVTGDAVGQTLSVGFSAPFRLVYLQISGGAAEQDELFLAEGRPSSMRVTITNSSGAVSSQDITLVDKAGPQPFYIGVDDVKEVTLTIQSSKGSGPDKHVAIAEVEFRGRS